LSDAPPLPMWCHGGRRSVKHKVEALIPALWKFWAPNRAWGASGATGYLLFSKKMGEKGVVLGICVFRLLADTSTLEPALTYEREDG
jgi:hypothetical protein